MDERKKAKAKTTVYLDADLLRAVKMRAAEEGRHDYEIYEEALRGYLAAGERAREGERLMEEAMRRVMLERMASSGNEE